MTLQNTALAAIAKIQNDEASSIYRRLMALNAR